MSLDERQHVGWKDFHVCIVLLLLKFGATTTLGDWVNHGGGIHNHRSAMGCGQHINATSVSKLGLRWRFLTGFDVSATPSIAGNTVYFPGWDGNLYALNAYSGELVWKKNLTKLAGHPTSSRATPVIYKHLLLVGLHGPAVVLALNRHCGSLVWKTRPLDNASNTVITMSGTAFEGFYFVGISSLQEFTPACCTFQGSFQKIRLKDGHVIWRTSMLPPNSGFFGVALWGSSPPIDEKRRMVYIGTGNNYEVPKDVEECEKNRPNKTRQDIPDPCIVEGVHEDSILAINIDNGSIVWSKQLQGYDVWTLPCSGSTTKPNCPTVMGPDYDFGEAPMLLDFHKHDCPPSTTHHCLNKCLVVSGQKSGVVWALECETGDIVWSTAAGPGGNLGGASWGSCTDGERVYTNIINSDKKNFTLTPRNSTTNGGGWVAMEARTGRILWTTADPNGARAFGPVSVTNGVVFAGSSTENGEIYGLDALSGAILWRSSTNATVYGGFSISGNCIYGGNGYSTSIPIGKTGFAVSAFCTSYSSSDHSLM